jgi:hypothetical protein
MQAYAEGFTRACADQLRQVSNPDFYTYFP